MFSKVTLSLFTFFLACPLWSFDVPRLKSYVNDRAGLVGRSAERQIDSALRLFHKKGGAQIVVLTLKDLQGESIEQASIKIVDEWKLGGAKNDNGVLVLISQKERKMRIEVGQGLEGNLPDAYAKRIIADIMSPLFKQGDFARGIYLGTAQIAKKTNPDISFVSSTSRSWKKKKRKSSLFKDVIIALIFIVFFIFGGRSPVLAFLLGSSMGRHRSYGGGSFGGGGAFGGGGGFSGGGASGGW